MSGTVPSCNMTVRNSPEGRKTSVAFPESGRASSGKIGKESGKPFSRIVSMLSFVSEDVFGVSFVAYGLSATVSVFVFADNVLVVGVSAVSYFGSSFLGGSLSKKPTMIGTVFDIRGSTGEIRQGKMAVACRSNDAMTQKTTLSLADMGM